MPRYTTFCIQCALESVVASPDAMFDPYSAVFEESAGEHVARVHPDPIATQTRRAELERLCAEKIASTS